MINNVDEAADVLVVRRVLRVPRDAVFAAWLDAKGMSRWMAPGMKKGSTVELDPRIGGQFKIVMHGDDDSQGGSKDYVHTGEYIAIDPPSSLSFTWISEATKFKTTLVRVDFVDMKGRTEVILTHKRLPKSEFKSHTDGWTQIMVQLEEMLLESA